MAEKQGTLRKKKETGERSHRTSRSFSQKRRAAVFLETLTAESYPKRPLSSGIERSLRSIRNGFPIRSSDPDFRFSQHRMEKERRLRAHFRRGSKFSLASNPHPKQRQHPHKTMHSTYNTDTRAHACSLRAFAAFREASKESRDSRQERTREAGHRRHRR